VHTLHCSLCQWHSGNHIKTNITAFNSECCSREVNEARQLWTVAERFNQLSWTVWCGVRGTPQTWAQNINQLKLFAHLTNKVKSEIFQFCVHGT
jgi:hypothetical protein